MPKKLTPPTHVIERHKQLKRDIEIDKIERAVAAAVNDGKRQISIHGINIDADLRAELEEAGYQLNRSKQILVWNAP